MNNFAEKQMLYQVWATDTKTNQLVPMRQFPKAGKDACELWVRTVQEQIKAGRYKDHVDPQCVPFLGNKPQLIMEN